VRLLGEMGEFRVSDACRPATLSPVTVPDHRELVAALLAVEGVAGASVEPSGSGPGTLRLQLAAGSDEVTVAGAVNRLLRAKFGLAVDADRVRVLDEPQQAASPLPPATAPSRTAPAAAPPPDAPPPGAAPRGAYARDVIDVGRSATDIHLATDTRVVSDVAGTPAPAEQNGRPPRLTIDRVQLVSAGLGVSVSVTLGYEGRTVTGEAEGAASQTGVHRSVAAATLRAVESVVGDNARFEVEHVELAKTGMDQTALVVVTMVTGRSTQRLSGSSVVREDTRQAMIRAVLAAVNRRMEPLLEGV
jgi:hypothetical protein